MTESLDECPNCSSAERSDVLTDYERTIKKCLGCNLMYVTPRPTEKSVRDFFANEYISDEDSLATSFTSHRADSLAREADLVKSLVPAGGTLVDVGAASGFFLAEFAKDTRWTPVGVEPSPMAAKAASERYSIEVRPGFLADQKFESESVDVVTSLDAFMLHLNPVDDLLEFSRIIKPSGYLVFEIPGLRYRFLKGTGLPSKLFHQGRTRINLPLHNFYFTTDSLRDMVEKRGFKFINSAPEQSPVYGNTISKVTNKLYYAATKLIYKLTGSKIHFAPKEILVFQKIK